ncbi:hypothetical protein RCL06_24215, partial [Salmonella enterica subsp. enterica serovar Typhimurium]
FVRWDMSGNVSRVAEFIKNVQKSNTLEEVLKCIPFRIVEIMVPLEEMYEMYVLQDSNLSEYRKYKTISLI